MQDTTESKARRKAPLRTTEPLGAWVAHDVKALAVELANRYGYTRGRSGISGLVTDLLRGRDPREHAHPASPATMAAVLSNRTVRALSALDERIRAGTSCEHCEALRRDLQDLRSEITRALARCVDTYEVRTQERLSNEDWSVE